MSHISYNTALGISAIIITKNEAANIAECLVSLQWVDEIVVVDADSSDGTADICRNYGAVVHVTDWSGFGAQKNKALNLARNVWILSIDADEKVTPLLRDEILQLVKKQRSFDEDSYVAYKIPRQNYFYNRLIKCLSSKHDMPIRLFQKERAMFSTDVVHEKVVVNGKVGQLQHHLIHVPFANLEELLDKANTYSSLGVQKLLAKKTRPSIGKTIAHALWTFVKIYFLKRGFLDGWPGFLIAFANFEGTFYRYAKLLEYYALQRQNRR